MTAIINNTELNFSLNMCQLYKLSTVDIELYRDFFALYNEREKGIADRAQLLYIAYFCANLDKGLKLSEKQFYELLEDDLTALDEIYNALFHKKKDWNFARIFERPSKNAIRYPKGYKLADVDDYQANYIKNRLHDVCIVDIEAETPGVLSCREYEIECWINEGIHSEYTEWDSFDTLELNVISHSKYWYSRKTQHFELTDKELSEVIFDFPIGFPFDLYSSSIKSNILNNEILDADMILRIYGPVQSPSLTIAGHNYEVDVMISDKEYLEINTLEKTVFLYTLCGEKINCFSKRSRQSDVFQKLPTGNLKIYSDYQLIFDIVMLNRRAEPKW